MGCVASGGLWWKFHPSFLRAAVIHNQKRCEKAGYTFKNLIIYQVHSTFLRLATPLQVRGHIKHFSGAAQHIP